VRGTFSVFDNSSLSGFGTMAVLRTRRSGSRISFFFRIGSITEIFMVLF